MNDLPWYVSKPELLDQIKDELEDYPELFLIVENQTIYVRGKYNVLSVDNKSIGSYYIEICFPVNYPEDIPSLREVCGKIPKTADRHFYINGNACLFIPEERSIYFPIGSGLNHFIENCVKPFFVGQLYYNETGKWPLGQRSHGVMGIIEYYKDTYKEKSTEVIKQFVLCIGARVPKGHWPCYCGSGKRLRKCHMPYVKRYKAQLMDSELEKLRKERRHYLGLK